MKVKLLGIAAVVAACSANVNAQSAEIALVADIPPQCGATAITGVTAAATALLLDGSTQQVATVNVNCNISLVNVSLSSANGALVSGDNTAGYTASLAFGGSSASLQMFGLGDGETAEVKESETLVDIEAMTSATAPLNITPDDVTRPAGVYTDTLTVEVSVPVLEAS